MSIAVVDYKLLCYTKKLMCIIKRAITSSITPDYMLCFIS